MMMKSSLRLTLAALCLALCASTARAGEEHLLQTEESFVARMNERAVSVAPGVYEVELPSGERVRVGFGEAGRRYDRDRLQAELQAAKAAPNAAVSNKRKIQVLTHALRGLADQAPGMEKSAVSGSTCNYPFTLDGGHTPGMVGGQTWGNASIGMGVDFGPPPPSYPKRSAYTYVATTAFLNQTAPYYSEDYDEVLSGLGTASTSATINCGSAVWSCASWESFSYVRDYGCTTGYRSLRRSS
jgi:hypothetical protein